MPTYDYQCTKCQYRFELRQSFSDEAVAACPSCDGKASRRISLVPVVFKGAGWYVNDYGKKGGGGGGATASTPSDESESSKGASSKSKPDASTGSASSGKKSESTQTPSSSTPSKPQSKSSDK